MKKRLVGTHRGLYESATMHQSVQTCSCAASHSYKLHVWSLELTSVQGTCAQIINHDCGSGAPSTANPAIGNCCDIITHVIQRPECADSLVTALNKHENKTELRSKNTKKEPLVVLHYKAEATSEIESGVASSADDDVIGSSTVSVPGSDSEATSSASAAHSASANQPDTATADDWALPRLATRANTSSAHVDETSSQCDSITSRNKVASTICLQDGISDEELEGAVGGCDTADENLDSYDPDYQAINELLENDYSTSSSDDSLIIDVIAAINQPMNEQNEAQEVADDDTVAICAIALSNQPPKFTCTAAGDCDASVKDDIEDDDDDDDLVIDAIAFNNQPPAVDLSDVKPSFHSEVDEFTEAMECAFTRHSSYIADCHSKEDTFDLLAQISSRETDTDHVDMLSAKDRTFSVLRDVTSDSSDSTGCGRTGGAVREDGRDAVAMTAILEDVNEGDDEIIESCVAVDNKNTASNEAIKTVRASDTQANTDMDNHLSSPCSESSEAPSAGAPRSEPSDTPSDVAPRSEPSDTPSDVAPRNEPSDTPSDVAPRSEPSDTPSDVAPRSEPSDTPSDVAPRNEPSDTPSDVAPRSEPSDTPSDVAPRSEPSDAGAVGAGSSTSVSAISAHAACTATQTSSESETSVQETASAAAAAAAAESGRFMHHSDTPFYKSDSMRLVSHAEEFQLDLAALKLSTDCDNDETLSSDGDDVIVSRPQEKFSDSVMASYVDDNDVQPHQSGAGEPAQINGAAQNGAQCLNNNSMQSSCSSSKKTGACQALSVTQDTNEPNQVSANHSITNDAANGDGCACQCSPNIAQSVQLFQPNLTSVDFSSLVNISKQLYQACVKTLCLSNPGLRHVSLSGLDVDDQLLSFIADHAPHLEKVSLVITATCPHFTATAYWLIFVVL